ncbi:hypothetical protein D3H65_05740 [Paraflavitalea soli]|uniref:Dienelactone hydrolase domain-containing protein n=2 Tax=Paraflavitalea soli TaxID=2315862 RepID=A0A3B7MH24_9BACT|nr:hypothetical protein D3H65_05740 [Paraflavitalea soli]
MSTTAQTVNTLLDSASLLHFKKKDYTAAAALYKKAFQQPLPYPSYFTYLNGVACFAYSGDHDLAFRYLDICKKMGWVDITDINTDTLIVSLKADKRWKPFETSLNNEKDLFLKSIDPALYGVQQNDHLKKIATWQADKSIPDDSLYTLLQQWSAYPVPGKKGRVVKYYTRINDTLNIPYFLYIPTNYDARKPNALLVYIPGGWWARPNLPKDEKKGYQFENPTYPYLEDANMIEIFPVVNRSVALYTDEGYINIEKAVIQTKKIFNIDDNKVFLAGFSDGGSSAYNIATGNPTQFAKFYAINGWPNGRGSFMNYTNRPVFSFSAEHDFYNNLSVKTRAAFAAKLGANWLFRTVAGEDHFYYPYAKKVLPLIFRNMQTASRPFPNNKITWFTGSNFLSRCDWLQVQIDTLRKTSKEHFSDTLRSFDMDGTKKVAIEYGNDLSQTTATFCSNTFTIDTYKTDSITIYISLMMVDLSQPVKVIINGREVYHQKTSIDRAFMVKQFLHYFDRTMLWVNKISLSVN